MKRRLSTATAFQGNVPPDECVETDRQALDLLHLALRKVEEGPVLRSQLEPKHLIGFDTETHAMKIPVSAGGGKHLDWMNDTVTFWSLSFQIDGEYRRWCLQQKHLQMFAEVLENPRAWLTAWNAKYDAHVCWNSGINLWEANLIDGLVLALLYDENRFNHGLKRIAEDYCELKMTPFIALFDRDIYGKKAKEFITPLFDLPRDRVSNYASFDSYACLKAAERLIRWLRKIPIEFELINNVDHPVKGGPTLWDHFTNYEMDLTRVLWRMERRGMHIDVEYLRQLLPRIDDDIAKLERNINRIAGRELSNPNQVAAYFFGPKEQGGLGMKPLKMTKGGQTLPKPCVDKEVMAALAEATEVAPMILELRQRQKMRSTYIIALLELAEYFEDKRIHPSFNQMGARTGRLSTKAPNSQNFPRPDGDIWGIRKAFVARPGHKLIVADYEQIEMRIMADCSGDKVMIKTIRDGKDLHAFTVSRMVPGVTYEEVVEAKKVKDKDKMTTRQKWLVLLRQDNKPVGFGIIYGAGPQTIGKKITILKKDITAKLDELGPHKVARKVAWAMEKNPLLDEEKALVKVGREAVAASKIQAYLQVFPGVKSYMEEIVTICGERKDTGRYFSTTKLVAGEPVPQYWGFVQTLLGRYRRLPEIVHHSNKVAQGHAEREAINTTIQGTAADIMSAAMIRIDSCPKLNRLGVWLLNQIHDELVLEVPEENAEEAASLVRQYMEHPLGDDVEALCVPIPVDLKIVDRWSQAK